MFNQLFYGDNLEVLRRHIKDESVDLCYIDPPFNSKRNYNQIYNNIGKEDRAQSLAGGSFLRRALRKRKLLLIPGLGITLLMMG